MLNKFRSSFPSQMVFGDILVSKPVEMATEMNKFFIKKISQLKCNTMTDADPLAELRHFLSAKPIANGQFCFREVSP